MVVPEICPTRPRAITSRATSSVLQRLKGTPEVAGSSQAMDFTSILTSGGKSSGACPNEVDLPVPLNPPCGIACATSRPPEGWCPAGRLSPCWRFLRRPKERSWREPLPSRHRCENVLASAGRCAPLRKARCEKGSGWACALLSRRDDLRRETLPWYTEENTSTKFSQSPLRACANRRVANASTGNETTV